jgi:uncharacterized protein YeaO (DUF488 family)
MSIAIKHAYDDPAKSDGVRVLVGRIWPRGVSKDAAAIDEWYKDIAPSNELRQWFGHDPDKWTEFQKRFRAELNANKEALKPLIENACKAKKLTLVYAARDTEHNNAVVIKAYLEKHLS